MTLDELQQVKANLQKAVCHDDRCALCVGRREALRFVDREINLKTMDPRFPKPETKKE